MATLRDSVFHYLSGLPLGHKLLGGLLSAAFTVTLVATTVVGFSGYLMSKHHFVPSSVQAIVDILSEDAVFDALIENGWRAKETLKAISEYPHIGALAIYRPNNELFVSYNGEPDAFIIPFTEPENVSSNDQYLIQVDRASGQTYSLYILTDFSLPAFLYWFAGVAGAIILFFLVVITILSTQFIRHFVTLPVRQLIETAGQVSFEENYEVRAKRYHQDEIGHLAEAFNTMLGRIASRDRQLTQEKERAEIAHLRAKSLTKKMQQNNDRLERAIKVRHRAEKNLRHFQNYLNDIIDSMPSALVAINSEMQINQCNKAAVQLADKSSEGVVGSSLEDSLPFLASCCDVIEKALREQVYHRVDKLPVGMGGAENILDVMIYPLSRDENPGVVIRMDNITERLRLEEMVVQTEKMRSVGGLAAGMAHEINNPLGAILQAIQNVRRRISYELSANQQVAGKYGLDLISLNAYLDERGITRFMESIREAGVRASKIVSNMLMFSRQNNHSLKLTSLSDLIERTIEIAASDFRLQQDFDFMHVCIEKELDPSLTAVPCIASEIQQVLLNLLKNAAYAVDHREDCSKPGVITIRTVNEGGQASIIVSDNGCGMDDETRKRVFEPFYTTKDVGAGNGLGLSVSYFIVTSHHKGVMGVLSEPGKGAEFFIRLPMAVAEVSEP